MVAFASGSIPYPLKSWTSLAGCLLGMSLSPDFIGVITLRTDENQLVWMPSLHRSIDVPVQPKFGAEPLLNGLGAFSAFTRITVSAFSMTNPNDASSRVHLHSPIQSFLCPVTFLG